MEKDCQQSGETFELRNYFVCSQQYSYMFLVGNEWKENVTAEYLGSLPMAVSNRSWWFGLACRIAVINFFTMVAYSNLSQD